MPSDININGVNSLQQYQEAQPQGPQNTELGKDSFMQLLRDAQMPAIKLLWAMSSVLCQRQRELTHVLSDLVEAPDEESVREYEVLSQLLRTNITWN